MPTLILLTFVLAVFALLSKRFMGSKFVRLVALFPLSLFVYFVTYIPVLKNSSSLLIQKSWIPSLGISLDFKLDGLSLLFSILISGIGTLIFWYAAVYLKTHTYLNRFFCFLGIFMGAMLGLVLSDNLITLFIFWELTSITSFFLIGFENEEEESRKSALWALSITGIGGFFLLLFGVAVGGITGTYSIHELLSEPSILQDNGRYGLLLVFVCIAAFTKSAQFPFHFWLPGAMKAPTPVSAYLHSATMVKAGIYILARFTPLLNDGHYWTLTLQVVGGLTMMYGALNSIFHRDMKSILAYSTISALGLLVFLLGIGTEMAIYAACVFVLVHALYKASLFMLTGTVDHSFHSRDIFKLSGIGRKMPELATSGLISALSCAGIPLTFGFIGKELIYESTFTHPVQNVALALTACAVLTNIFLTCSGFLVGIKPFWGQVSKQLEGIKRVELGLWLPPLILSFFSLLFGLLPFLANDFFVHSMAEAIFGREIIIELKIWHGWSEVLLLSGLTIILGGGIYLVIKRHESIVSFLYKFNNFSPQRMVEYFVERFRIFAFKYTRFFQNGYLRVYLMYIVLFFIGLVGYKLFADVPLRVNTTGLSEFRAYELVVFLITVISVLFAIITSSRLTAIAATGVVGYCICLIFVFYGAPDLAMTQFAIDTLTVVLFVLVLFKLPSFLKLSNRKIQVRDAVISIAFGCLVSLITLQALVSPADKEISRFYADNVYELAKGKNVVNVILVDFRGFDTLIETIVLSIAALGVFSLLKYKKNDEEVSE